MIDLNGTMLRSVYNNMVFILFGLTGLWNVLSQYHILYWSMMNLQA